MDYATNAERTWKMIIATWKMTGIFNADAQLVANEIAELGEEVTPEQIVEAAKDESKELHKCFEWNDNIAAENWRKYQARKILGLLVIRETEDKTAVPLRVFYKNDNGGYKPSEKIFRIDDEYQKLLQTAWAELRAFKNKYARLQELSEIFALID